MEPAVSVYGLGGLLWGIEVPDHDVVTPDHYLARSAWRALCTVGIDDPDLDVVDGPPRGASDEFWVVIMAAHGGDA